MKIAKGNATVAGINFAIFADITKRGMIAVNEATGEVLGIQVGTTE